jgi:hypothetical protein
MNTIKLVDFRTNNVISIFTPSINVGKFKQQARKIKKEQGLSHHEALELVAKKYQYHHWHHVTEMSALTEPTEKAYRQGLLIAFDIKEAEYVDEEFFKKAEWAEKFCKDELWKHYLETSEDDEDEDALREYFTEDFEGLVFFRYVGKRTPSNLKNALKLINKSCFWSPNYVWLQGTFYDTYFEPAYDEEGHAVAVRF